MVYYDPSGYGNKSSQGKSCLDTENIGSGKEDDAKSAVDRVPDEFKTMGKCDDFATSFGAILDDEEIEHRFVYVYQSEGDWLYSDKAKKAIGAYHYGVQVGDIVFDNLTLDGMNFNSWLKDLGYKQGFGVFWEYVDKVLGNLRK